MPAFGEEGAILFVLSKGTVLLFWRATVRGIEADASHSGIESSDLLHHTERGQFIDCTNRCGMYRIHALPLVSATRAAWPSMPRRFRSNEPGQNAGGSLLAGFPRSHQFANESKNKLALSIGTETQHLSVGWVRILECGEVNSPN